MALQDYIPLALQTYNYMADQETSRDVTKPMGEAYQQGIDYTRGTFDPYVEEGQKGLGRWGSLLEDPSQITEDPGYQFGQQQGQQALERSAAGDLLSGQTLLDVNKWGQDYGQTYYDRALGRQADIAKTGMQAGGMAAPQVSRLYEAKGEVPATRELLQQMNRKSTLQGLTRDLPSQGGQGALGQLVSGGAKAVGGGLNWVGDAISGVFGGGMGDDLSNLVSGSVFDPGTWGDMFGGDGGFDFDLGETFWDGMGEVADFFR